jgi:glycerophosphoryl diester phosphodiesterase
MSSDPASRGPRIIAHRGASAYAPENTLAAFDLAIAQGADLIEFDVHLSADDQPVIIHDETLERTTDGQGRVRGMSLRALKRLDAGRWYGTAFRGQRLQSVGEVFERYRGRVGFAVELKAGGRTYPGIEDRVVSLVEIYDVVADSLILSFDRPALATVARRNPELRRVLLVDTAGDAESAHAESPSSAIGLAARLASATRVEAVRTANRAIYVWTVNDDPTITRLARLGVDGIITDVPDRARALLSEHWRRP